VRLNLEHHQVIDDRSYQARSAAEPSVSHHHQQKGDDRDEENGRSSRRQRVTHRSPEIHLLFAINPSFICLKDIPIIEARPAIAATLRFNFAATRAFDAPLSRSVRSGASSSGVHGRFFRNITQFILGKGAHHATTSRRANRQSVHNVTLEPV
jgi:hypothetical protein